MVLDADGLVRAKFEGAITVDELEDALWDALASRCRRTHSGRPALR